ncbi:uncharacterized protein LOC131950037 isoform X3 [Physella acuta]|uniref:uncharacterized protein LOC131950037 isoform X3 n=1 Tax=Physella acuta TaxID=109671 RepID=UPI0027DE8FEB|nr:uncharacterized protein LOC131950037 isoform X3 [Physella acuta]
MTDKPPPGIPPLLPPGSYPRPPVPFPPSMQCIPPYPISVRQRYPQFPVPQCIVSPQYAILGCPPFLNSNHGADKQMVSMPPTQMVDFDAGKAPQLANDQNQNKRSTHQDMDFGEVFCKIAKDHGLTVEIDAKEVEKSNKAKSTLNPSTPEFKPSTCSRLNPDGKNCPSPEVQASSKTSLAPEVKPLTLNPEDKKCVTTSSGSSKDKPSLLNSEVEKSQLTPDTASVAGLGSQDKPEVNPEDNECPTTASVSQDNTPVPTINTEVEKCQPSSNTATGASLGQDGKSSTLNPEAKTCPTTAVVGSEDKPPTKIPEIKKCQFLSLSASGTSSEVKPPPTSNSEIKKCPYSTTSGTCLAPPSLKKFISKPSVVNCKLPPKPEVHSSDKQPVSKCLKDAEVQTEECDNRKYCFACYKQLMADEDDNFIKAIYSSNKVDDGSKQAKDVKPSSGRQQESDARVTLPPVQSEADPLPKETLSTLNKGKSSREDTASSNIPSSAIKTVVTSCCCVSKRTAVEVKNVDLLLSDSGDTVAQAARVESVTKEHLDHIRADADEVVGASLNKREKNIQQTSHKPDSSSQNIPKSKVTLSVGKDNEKALEASHQQRDTENVVTESSGSFGVVKEKSQVSKTSAPPPPPQLTLGAPRALSRFLQGKSSSVKKSELILPSSSLSSDSSSDGKPASSVVLEPTLAAEAVDKRDLLSSAKNVVTPSVLKFNKLLQKAGDESMSSLPQTRSCLTSHLIKRDLNKTDMCPDFPKSEKSVDLGNSTLPTGKKVDTVPLTSRETASFPSQQKLLQKSTEKVLSDATSLNKLKSANLGDPQLEQQQSVKDFPSLNSISSAQTCRTQSAKKLGAESLTESSDIENLLLLANRVPFSQVTANSNLTACGDAVASGLSLDNLLPNYANTLKDYQANPFQANPLVGNSFNVSQQPESSSLNLQQQSLYNSSIRSLLQLQAQQKAEDLLKLQNLYLQSMLSYQNYQLPGSNLPGGNLPGVANCESLSSLASKGGISHVGLPLETKPDEMNAFASLASAEENSVLKKSSTQNPSSKVVKKMPPLDLRPKKQANKSKQSDTESTDGTKSYSKAPGFTLPKNDQPTNYMTSQTYSGVNCSKNTSDFSLVSDYCKDPEDSFISSHGSTFSTIQDAMRTCTDNEQKHSMNKVILDLKSSTSYASIVKSPDKEKKVHGYPQDKLSTGKIASTQLSNQPLVQPQQYHAEKSNAQSNNQPFLQPLPSDRTYVQPSNHSFIPPILSDRTNAQPSNHSFTQPLLSDRTTAQPSKKSLVQPLLSDRTNAELLTTSDIQLTREASSAKSIKPLMPCSDSSSTYSSKSHFPNPMNDTQTKKGAPSLNDLHFMDAFGRDETDQTQFNISDSPTFESTIPYKKNEPRPDTKDFTEPLLDSLYSAVKAKKTPELEVSKSHYFRSVATVKQWNTAEADQCYLKSSWEHREKSLSREPLSEKSSISSITEWEDLYSTTSSNSNVDEPKNYPVGKYSDLGIDGSSVKASTSSCYGLDEIKLKDESDVKLEKKDEDAKDKWKIMTKKQATSLEHSLIDFRLQEKYTNLTNRIQETYPSLTKAEAREVLENVYSATNGLKGYRQHQILAEVDMAIKEMFPNKLEKKKSSMSFKEEQYNSGSGGPRKEASREENSMNNDVSDYNCTFVATRSSPSVSDIDSDSSEEMEDAVEADAEVNDEEEFVPTLPEPVSSQFVPSLSDSDSYQEPFVNDLPEPEYPQEQEDTLPEPDSFPSEGMVSNDTKKANCILQ